MCQTFKVSEKRWRCSLNIWPKQNQMKVVIKHKTQWEKLMWKAAAAFEVVEIILSGAFTSSTVCLLIALIQSPSSSLILTTTPAPRTNKWKGLISVCGAKHHRLTFTVQGSGRSARAPEGRGAAPGAGGMFTHWAFPYWSYISEQGGEP